MKISLTTTIGFFTPGIGRYFGASQSNTFTVSVTFRNENFPIERGELRAVNNPSSQQQPATSRIPWRNESGQSMVELSLILLILVVLAYGLMDFCTAIYEKQVIVNLTREGANLSARGSGESTAQIMTNALAAIIQEATPLNLSTNSTSGLLILTAATNNNKPGFGLLYQPTIKVRHVVRVAARLARGWEPTRHCPAAIVAQAGHNIYIAEIYYKFNVPAPLRKLIRVNCDQPIL